MKQQTVLLLFLSSYQTSSEYVPIAKFGSFVGKNSLHEEKSISKIINETLCQKQLDFFLRSFRNNEIWALQRE